LDKPLIPWLAAARPPRLLGLFGVFVDVVDGFLDARDLLGVLVGDLDPELLLEGHDQLDGVEAVRAEVVHEGRLGRHQVLLDSELIHDDLLHTIGNRLHEAPPGMLAARGFPIGLVSPRRLPSQEAAARQVQRSPRPFYMWKPPSTPRTCPVM
jgi:hypothetical protein